ncbi:snRNA-activating protein complex subunit [Nymphaea colorata]|nr:snRNA-activating protein complex subunit [Nymphaea colorata]
MASGVRELPGLPLQEEGVCRARPRGGPIFVPGLVGPLTSVPQFQASVVRELEGLEKDLCELSSQSCNVNLSVDDLKILSEEDLVERALKEAFKLPEETGSVSSSEEQSVKMNADVHNDPTDDFPCPERANQESSTETMGFTAPSEGSSETVVHSVKKKRGRVFDRNSRAAELDGADMSKVEQLAQVKRRQDEDKAKAELHSLRAEMNERTTSVAESQAVKSSSSIFITSSSKMNAAIPQEFTPVQFPEIVLTIEIYHNIRKGQKSQEFLVLGKQTLTELRDKIYCSTDQLMQQEGVHDPSGYFLIEGSFCNDLRDRSAIDYSEPIRNWLQNSKDEALAKWEAIVSGNSFKKHKSLLGGVATEHLPIFKSLAMHKTRFCDLKFRLGSYYLYCHQGDCRHAVVIRDMRLIHPEDVQNKAAYPLLIFQIRTGHRKCSICGIFRAKKITVDDKYAPENPSYFCDNCYFLLHYSEAGTLLYDDFTVYDYFCE